MYRTLLIFYSVLFAGALNAQGWLPQGVRSSSMGHASVTFVDAYSFHHNPGALGFLKKGTAGIAYESRYMLKELQHQSFAVAQPLKRGVVSLGGQFYGYEQFRTNRIGAGYSIRLTDQISAGVQINYLSLRLDPTYGIKHTVTGEFGLLARINKKVQIGFSVMNLGRAKLSEFQDDRFTTLVRLGANYRIIEDLLLAMEVSQEVGLNARVRGGLEYHPKSVESLYLRCGVQSAPMELGFGLGWSFDKLQIDLGTQYNQLLGWTPTAGLTFDFYNPKKE